MKNTIKKILKETVDNKKDKFDRYIISTLKKEGFVPSTDYVKVIKFLNSNFTLSGMEAFEMYQLFLNNFKTVNTTKKIKSANSSARDLVSSKIPFKGSNTHAEYVGKTYVVYSYNWYPIFVFKDGQWFENENRYSMSTAKQMSQLRPNGQGEIIKASKSKLSDIIYS
jgi:ribosomal protein S8